ncbi:DNA-directed RNA polymerases i and iii subunit rpac2 [Phtheirospermum japonicum]|uniref:DNA-directed RNA polymerases i and iii subunit rpac2 n=1 Tax=Phtheirospermum japonicum TaxID=374723 RepID=A0A830BAL5_9LAMI|nr:DNA-directed RNA polymerases i and iii subunit rpac2 [Phtheirospermum japonicum]
MRGVGLVVLGIQILTQRDLDPFRPGNQNSGSGSLIKREWEGIRMQPAYDANMWNKTLNMRLGTDQQSLRLISHLPPRAPPNSRVSFCGYSRPHPGDDWVNLRVQTTGDTAREVLIDSCQDLMLVCQHVRSTVDQAVMVFKSKQGVESKDIK